MASQYTQVFAATFTRYVVARPDGPLDPPLVTATLRTITGHVYDAGGSVVVGATVLLFRQYDNFLCGTATSNGSGAYSFNRRSDDTQTYYTIAYSLVGGVTQVHGASNRGLVPA